MLAVIELHWRCAGVVKQCGLWYDVSHRVCIIHGMHAVHVCIYIYRYIYAS